MFKSFYYALGFLTRLPVPDMESLPSEREQGDSVLFYPLVGLVIGLVLTATAYLLNTVEPLLTAAILLAIWVAITGGLHIDGLADVADAWVGGQGDRERTLAIMKDPTCGPIAVAGVVVLLILKLAGLHAILTDAHWTVLLLVPIIGRGALIASFLYIPYVRVDGLGAVLANNLSRPAAKKVLLILILCCFLIWSWNAVWIVAGCSFIFYLIRSSVLKRINGQTGDVAGTICELIETTALILAAIVL
ncbi:MAG: adenosylcobinamide-GDP ribazoletransferase [Sedimenticola sp.]|nr:adenosylcobinamide-GDP ribazoletransferase [Sedimenticola sp.]